MASSYKKPMNEVEWKAYIYKAKTWVYDKQLPGWPLGTDGFIEIEYSDDDMHNTRKIAKFPVVSVWLDPTNTSSRNTCKVLASVPKKAMSKEDEITLDFAEALKLYGKVDHHVAPMHTIGLDLHGNILRYGAKEALFLTKSYGSNRYDPIPIYDTKALAFKAIMEALSSYSSVNIAGLDLINLNSISDSVLEELGFIKVPDILGRGVPMWCGDAVQALSMGAASYGDRRWSSGSGDDTEKATHSEVVESFLAVLEAELTAA